MNLLSFFKRFPSAVCLHTSKLEDAVLLFLLRCNDEPMKNILNYFFQIDVSLQLHYDYVSVAVCLHLPKDVAAELELGLITM